MAKTQVQRNADYYARIIEEGKKSPHSSKYQAFCDALKTLVETSRELSKSDRQLSPNEYANLKKSYRKVKQACQDYLNPDMEFTDFEKERKGIIENISKVISKDLMVLNGCNPKEPGKLSDIIMKSRSHVINLNSKDLIKVGGALSSRIPLKTSNDKKGFFTPLTVYNQNEKITAVIDKHKEKFTQIPELAETFDTKIERLRTIDRSQDILCSACPDRPIDEYIKFTGSPSRAEEKIIRIGRMLGIGKDEKEVKAMFNKHKSLRKDLISFINDMAPIANERGIMAYAGIKKGADISSRNCAMTNVAKMLHCENLLANSVPMTVKIDGKDVQGVFMETVDGSDVKRIKEDDPILDADAHSFQSPEALQQIIDLQTIDFICGNVDRHFGNVIFQFNKNSSGDIRLSGIKGIDNDCAFGTPNIHEGRQVLRMVNPDKMQYITESMWKTLQHINKDTLQVHLAGTNLSPEEIDAAWERTEKVRDAVISGKIKPISSEHWKTNSLTLSSLKKDNYLDRIKGVARECNSGVFNRAPKENNVLYNKDVEERKADIKVMYDKLDDIVSLREKMEKAQALFFDSSEYKMMQKRFEKIETLTKDIHANCKSPEEVPPEKAAALEDAYAELADKSFKYIQLKKLVPYQVRGQARRDLAQDLMNFANSTMDEMYLNQGKEDDLKEMDLQEDPEMV